MEQKWIPITDHLPEEPGFYLTYAETAVTQLYESMFSPLHVTYFGRADWWASYKDEITHWMKLPAHPPQI